MTDVLQIRDASEVAQARRAFNDLGHRIGLDETEQARVAIAVTELATNLLKHGGGGILLADIARLPDAEGLDCIALDRGPGMADVSVCFRDGYSTAGSSGGGLGAVRRQANVMDVYSQAGLGTAIFARFVRSTPASARNALPASLLGSEAVTGSWGGICVAKPGEDVCGDNWHLREREDGLILALADGLGHGTPAAAAANVALATLDRHYLRRPKEIIEAMHAALRQTRGAAVAVAHLDRRAHKLHFAAIGNIAGTLVGQGASRRLMSLNGTVGHAVRRIQEMDYPIGDEAMLILHSDGIGGAWSMDRYPALASHHPSLVAGLLYRDFQRGRDDAAALVARIC